MLSFTKSRTAGKTLLQTLFFFLLVTQICFGQWVQVGLNGKSIDEIAVKDQTIFATTDEYGGDPIYNFVGKLYRSLDNGFNWTMIVDSCLDVAISPTDKLFMIKDTLQDFLQDRSLYSSTDNGDSWMLSNAVVQLADSFDYVYPNNITITPEGNVILSIFYPVPMTLITGFGISNDDGLSWSTPGRTVKGGNIFDFRDNFIITNGFAHGCGAYHGYIYLSSDYGITWNHLGDPPASYPNAIGFFANGNIILGGEAAGNIPPGVHISEDFCNTWVQIAILNSGGFPNRRSGLHWSSGSSEGMLIGIEDLGVLLFTDEGDSLGFWNEGLTNLNVQALTLDNNGYVYVGTGNGVWRRPLSEVTPVEGNQMTIPSNFNLSNNFPNPFNPSTKIKYSVPQSSQVQIKVYDVLGNEIETLVNEEKPAGTYELTWNASGVSAKGGYASGVYFYQLKAGSFVETKKMLLLK